MNTRRVMAFAVENWEPPLVVVDAAREAVMGTRQAGVVVDVLVVVVVVVVVVVAGLTTFQLSVTLLAVVVLITPVTFSP